MPDYADLLRKLMVDEYGKTPDEAAALVKKHTRIVMNGVVGGLSFTSIRACAMAIEMAESEQTNGT